MESDDGAETPFGAARRSQHGQIDLSLAPGDRVLVVGGRMRGAKAILEEVEDVSTPSGGTVRIARVRRPRAGVSWEFPDMLRRIEG